MLHKIDFHNFICLPFYGSLDQFVCKCADYVWFVCKWASG